MKASANALVLVFAVLLTPVSAQAGEDRTITKVVRLLQGLMDTSKSDADNDALLYSKYKCFTDTSAAEKKASIKQSTEEIAILENRIEEFQAENGELSGEVAALAANIAANNAADQKATNIRRDSKAAFVGMEADLITAIGQMTEALDVLNSIALAQTQTAFLTVESKRTQDVLSPKARASLIAVSALLPADQQSSFESLLQATTTKAMMAKKNEIVKILSNLRTTFQSNLQSAKASDRAEKKAFDTTIEILTNSTGIMQASKRGKEGKMGDNDGELSADKGSYDDAVALKLGAEGALASIREEAATKAKNFDHRKMLRANEDAAISQAIAILNSDAAYTSFAGTTAVSTGALSFVQLGKKSESMQLRVAAVLEKGRSRRLANLAAGLRAGNPFTAVVEEIAKMKKTIGDEAIADGEKKTWCVDERRNSRADLATKKGAILSMEGALSGLQTTIGSNEEPKTGLMMQISNTQASLLQNQEGQKTETRLRGEENLVYKTARRNLDEAEDLLERSIAVLTKFYDTLDEKYINKVETGSLVQMQKMKKAHQAPEDPDAAGKGSLGQHVQDGGGAITILEFILTETRTERTTADQDETSAKSDYEGEMKIAISAENGFKDSLVSLQGSLADAQKIFQQKTADLKDTSAAKNAITTYLSSIKAGCDFIMTHFDQRESNRGTESGALDNAMTLITNSSVYKNAVASAAGTGDDAPAAPTGDDAAAAPTGDDAPAAPTGDDAAAAPTGDDAAAAPTGDDAAAAPTGDDAAAADDSTGLHEKKVSKH